MTIYPPMGGRSISGSRFRMLRLKADIIAVNYPPQLRLRRGQTPGANCHDRAAIPWDRPRRKHCQQGEHLDIHDDADTVKRLELLKEAVPKVSRVLILSYLRSGAPLLVAALNEILRSE
jgi:hypothetical protein